MNDLFSLEPERSEVIRESVAKITEKQNLLEKWIALGNNPDFPEAEEMIISLRKSIAYWRWLLNLFEGNKPMIAGQVSLHSHNSQLDIHRSPIAMLRPEYRKRLNETNKMPDLIKSILESRGQTIKTRDLVNIMYETKSRNELRRARYSLGVQLRIGASKGLWFKINRGCFVACSEDLSQLSGS